MLSSFICYSYYDHMHAPHQLVLRKNLASFSLPEASFPSLRSARVTRRVFDRRRWLRRPLQSSATLVQDRPMPPTAKPPAFFQNILSDGQADSKSPAESIEPFCNASYGALQASAWHTNNRNCARRGQPKAASALLRAAIDNMCATSSQYFCCCCRS